MNLISDRTARIATENAFKVGPYITALEEAGNKVVKCNLGEPDFPLPSHIRDEVKRQLDLDNVHYTNPQGTPGLRAAVAKYIGEDRGLDYSPEQVVVLEAAVLLEAGWQDLVDQIWVVVVDPEVAIARASARDGVEASAVQARIDAQMSNAERIGAADRVIDNSGDAEQLTASLKAAWAELGDATA